MVASNPHADARRRASLFSSLGLIAPVLLAALVASASSNYEPLGPSSRRTSLVISEIMYHPTNRADGRNLEYIELHNAGELPERVGGYRLSGDVEFTLPTNVVMPAGGFLVVAPAPADVQEVYGITNVIGGFTNAPGAATNALPNGSGTVRLRNHLGAVLLEVNYSDDAPWPLAADGAGHSLVLARPSYGERDVRAWAASAAKGGSPGVADPVPSGPLENIFINEIFARTNDPSRRFVELYNHSASPVNVGGCWLSDDPTTNKFRIGDGANIAAQGFVTFTESILGFPLDAAGGTVFLISASGARVLDAVKFGGQAADASFGRFPDGAPTFHELIDRTPDAANAALLVRDVVLNEIMYRPPSGDSGDEFIELFNRGSNSVNLGGWRLSGGVSFTFPSNAVLSAGGYLAVAGNAAHLRTNYAFLGTTNLIGDFNGNLSADGERLTLSRPELLVRTNSADGTLTTNSIRVVVAEVHYHDGGRWGKWAHGAGSSLELIDSHSDARLGPNWADSDESGKSAWTTVEVADTLAFGDGQPANSLEIILLGAGEALLDDVEVFMPGGGNLVANGNFNSGANGWVMEGTHDLSEWQSSGGTGNSGCLRLRATARGEYLANRVRVPLAAGLTRGVTATLRAKARWLRGSPDIVLRLKGNYLEAVGLLPIPANLGTPGAPNSVALTNIGPAITDVLHTPVLPAAVQPVVVTARVHDPDGLANVVVQYRVDPATTLTSVPMNDFGTNGDAVAGDGIFGAAIPGRIPGTIVAFRVLATDARGASSRFPNRGKVYPGDTLLPECLVRFGEVQRPSGPSRFATYHLWAAQATLNRWNVSAANNSPLDATFVYNDQRVIYNAGALYAGSALSLRVVTGPLTSPRIGYALSFPARDRMLGATDMTLDFNTPDTGAWGGHSDHEQHCYWFAKQMGLPFCHRRYVYFYLNGANNSTVFEDAQQPNGDMLEQWFPDDSEGDLYKQEIWWPWSDLSGPNVPYYWIVPMNDYSRGTRKDLASYRWSMLKRAVNGSANDYSNVFTLVDALNSPTATYAANIEATIDIEQWARSLAFRHALGDLDFYSVRASHNMYFYKPKRGKWQLLNFDFDLAYFENPATELFWVEYDTQAQRLFQHPPFVRAYLRALQDMVDGPMASASFYPMFDAHYWLLSITNGLGSAELSPDATDITVPGASWSRRGYVDLRRNTIVNNHLRPITNVVFAVTTPAGNFGSSNLVTLTGTAPIGVTTIQINGVEFAVRWTDATHWAALVALGPGTNALEVQGFDREGRPLASRNVTVNYTGTNDAPEQSLVLNEILYSPAIPNADFVEIFNRSTRTAFDLGGWRLNGVDFTFRHGTLVLPGAYLVVARDYSAFGRAYGFNIPVAGQFAGSLDNGGETLSLVQPGPPSDRMINGVTYDDDAPWPLIAESSGASLQLIDPTQDNRRVLNWAAVTSSTNTFTNGTGTLLPITQAWKFNQSGADLGTGWRARDFDDSAWPSGAALFYNETAPLPAPTNTPLMLGILTYYFRTHFTFNGDPAQVALVLNTVVDDGAVVYLNGQEIFRIAVTNDPVHFDHVASRTVVDAVYEGPFTAAASNLLQGDNVLAVEVHQSATTSSDVVFGLSVTATAAVVNASAIATPGAQNSVRASLPPFPPLWLNEVQSDNVRGPTDRAGHAGPWIELFNNGPTPISLEGCHLAPDVTNLTQWTFPTNASVGAADYLVVWLDGATNETTATELHANFSIPRDRGTVALVKSIGARPAVLDYIRYASVTTDHSFGDFPDGNPLNRRLFIRATPGGTNNASTAPYAIYINEWMADNQSTLADPADGDYEDWFELYNPNPVAVNLSGYYLSDSITNINERWRVPAGTLIGPRGFLLVWADGEPEQNGAPSTALHAAFKLNKAGESIAVFGPEGQLLDAVTFGAQLADTSEGRWPNGASEPFYPNSTPTPGAANLIAATNQPTVTLLGVVRGPAGELTLSWTSLPGRAYRVLFKEQLSDPVWLAIAGDVVASTTNCSKSVTAGTGGDQRFFRVQLLVNCFDHPSLRVEELGIASDGSATLAWNSVPRSPYRVLFKNRLDEPDWHALGADILATDHRTSHTDRPQAGQRFYRVEHLSECPNEGASSKP
jgi:hypothetical protein